MTTEAKLVENNGNSPERMRAQQYAQELQLARQYCDSGSFEELNDSNFQLIGANAKLLDTYRMDAIASRMNILNRQRHTITDEAGGLSDEIDNLTKLYLELRRKHYPEIEGKEYAPLIWVPDSDREQLRFALSIGIPELISLDNFPWLALLDKDSRIGLQVEAFNTKIGRWQTIYDQVAKFSGLPGDKSNDIILDPIRQTTDVLYAQRNALLFSMTNLDN